MGCFIPPDRFRDPRGLDHKYYQRGVVFDMAVPRRRSLVSDEGEQRAEAGFIRVMEPEIYRTRGDILR